VGEEKTGFYSVLFLFTIGTTRGKSGTLLTELLSFKRQYDQNVPFSSMFSDIAISNPKRYESLGIQDVAREIHSYLSGADIAKVTEDVYSEFPPSKIIPREAYNAIVSGNAKKMKLDQLVGEVSASMVVPYPPGIPVIMPGEVFTKKIVDYLKTYQDFDNNFPGFETEIHGVEAEKINGKVTYFVYCVQLGSKSGAVAAKNKPTPKAASKKTVIKKEKIRIKDKGRPKKDSQDDNKKGKRTWFGKLIKK